MKITKIHPDREAESPAGVAIEILGTGADFYSDGTFYAWQDNNGMFNRCEATGNLSCYIPVDEVRAAIAAAKNALGISFAVGAIIPGIEEIEEAE